MYDNKIDFDFMKQNPNNYKEVDRITKSYKAVFIDLGARGDTTIKLADTTTDKANLYNLIILLSKLKDEGKVVFITLLKECDQPCHLLEDSIPHIQSYLDSFEGEYQPPKRNWKLTKEKKEEVINKVTFLLMLILGVALFWKGDGAQQWIGAGSSALCAGCLFPNVAKTVGWVLLGLGVVVAIGLWLYALVGAVVGMSTTTALLLCILIAIVNQNRGAK